MPYLNKSILLGYLTADPELQCTTGGTPFCNFTIAQNFRTPEGEEGRAEFYECTVWRGWAEIFVRAAQKGTLVLVEGRLRQDQWDDPETGKKRSRLKVQAQLVVAIPRNSDLRDPKEEKVEEQITL